MLWCLHSSWVSLQMFLTSVSDFNSSGNNTRDDNKNNMRKHPCSCSQCPASETEAALWVTAWTTSSNTSWSSHSVSGATETLRRRTVKKWRGFDRVKKKKKRCLLTLTPQCGSHRLQLFIKKLQSTQHLQEMHTSPSPPHTLTSFRLSTYFSAYST